MANDPRDLSGSRLRKAIYELGRNPALREEFIALLKRAESCLGYKGPVRDDVTGPIVDALHDDSDIYEKLLVDGTRIRFYLRTKIARDFLMAAAATSSHVWEPQTTKLLLALAAGMSGDVIIGGAYFGDHAILLAPIAAARKMRVHCFEPNVEQASMLEENARLNDLDNVVVKKMGLWSKSNVRLKLDGFDSFANAVEVDSDEDAFDTISIDDYRANGGFEIGLIQLDIEGAELEALRGAAETLRADKPHVVFEVHRDYVDWSRGLENTDVCRLLAGYGYTVFAVRDFNSNREMPGKPVELIPAATVHLEGPSHGFNMVAVQDAAVFSGPEFKIVKGVSPKLLAHKSPALHHPTDGL